MGTFGIQWLQDYYGEWNSEGNIGCIGSMGLTCQNNLYFLKGSTFIGGAATVADKIGEFASGTSRIWDMLVRCFARPMKGHRELQIRFYALIAYSLQHCLALWGESISQ